MRTTVDIPDPVYRRLKSAAALPSCSVKELVLSGVEEELKASSGRRPRKRVRLPVIDSRKPGWLDLTNRWINEILFP